MSPSTEDHDLSRLPKWAQSEITYLRRRVEELAREKIADYELAVTGGCDTWVDPYAEPTPAPLGKSQTVQFRLGDLAEAFHGNVHARTATIGGMPVVEITAPNGEDLHVIPRTANTVLVVPIKR